MTMENDVRKVVGGDSYEVDVGDRNSQIAIGRNIRQKRMSDHVEQESTAANRHERSSVSVGRQVKILFLAANPIDTDPLRLSQEIRTVDERMRSATYGDRFKLIQYHAVRVADLAKCLLRHTPHVVHFAGHGTQSGEIVLEDEIGLARTVPPQALSGLFRILRDNIRCVSLNACFSQIQAEAIVKEIDCVVGMSELIGDDAAVRFAGGFYRALAFGRSIQTAFELGCNEIDLSNLDESAVPKLLAKPGVDASNIYLV